MKDSALKLPNIGTLTSFRDKELEEKTLQHRQDLGVVESKVRKIQSTAYCGDLILSFEFGILKPICRNNQTEKIK